MSKIILTDIDDTVLEFAKCFQDWAVKLGHVPDGDVRGTGSISKVFGWSAATTHDFIDDFYNDAAFGELTPEPCALEVLPRLRAAGYDFVAITACSDEPPIVEKRRKNLQEVFGFAWRAVYCTGVRQPKDKFLRTFEPTYWIEDNTEHAARGSELGHHSLLLDRPYNEGFSHPGVKRVSCWREIESLIRTAQ